MAICFVHFSTVSLSHLDAAWYALSRQSFNGITRIYFLDNNSPHDPEDIHAVLRRYPIPVPVIFESDKHGDPTRTHSWSMNRVFGMSHEPWVLFCRSDYLMADTLVDKFLSTLATFAGDDWGGFVTSYMVGLPDTPSYLEPTAPWRTEGAQALMLTLGNVLYTLTDADAGVWLTERRLVVASRGWDEALQSWGWQQTIWQRGMRAVGAEIITIPEPLYFHMFHPVPNRSNLAASDAERKAQGYV